MKYVVASSKPMNGTYIFCGATTEDGAKLSLEQLQLHDRTKDYGPFRIITQDEAEKKRLYGD